MKQEDLYWALERVAKADCIPGEFYLLDRPHELFFAERPHKSEMTVICICARGELHGQINLTPVCAKAPGMLVILAEQIVQFERPSTDFEGVFILMSKSFTEKIALPESTSAFLSIRNAPFIPLNDMLLEGMLDFCRMVRKVLRYTKEDFNRRLVITHLNIAYFYGVGYYLLQLTEKDKRTRSEIIVEDFLRLVQQHHQRERSLDFYADRLSITVKHLSAAVKGCTGKSAKQWLDDYIILEAKRLLSSTDLTVQQISDELNFPSQSFFGKYFRRKVGVSPLRYKLGG